jgi:hypothetical protein
MMFVSIDYTDRMRAAWNAAVIEFARAKAEKRKPKTFEQWLEEENKRHPTIARF